MPRKPSPPNIAPLQRVVAEPISDPAEQAALDKVRERNNRKAKGPRSAKNPRKQNAAQRVRAKARS